MSVASTSVGMIFHSLIDICASVHTCKRMHILTPFLLQVGDIKCESEEERLVVNYYLCVGLSVVHYSCDLSYVYACTYRCENCPSELVSDIK